MSRRLNPSLKGTAPAKNAAARSARKVVMIGKRMRIASAALRGPYLPPEQWYEPRAERRGGAFAVIVRPARQGYCHIGTEDDIRGRLAQLPEWMLAGLDLVQFSTMTRKKRRAPCYGMQWGSTIYLYPIEESLVESFVRPPRPQQKIEASMYGARWEDTRGQWRLVWTEAALPDFYLNNVLIHELGHILDSRNSLYLDRERYAEWFAVEHGYKASRRAELAQQAAAKYVVRRHGEGPLLAPPAPLGALAPLRHSGTQFVELFRIAWLLRLSELPAAAKHVGKEEVVCSPLFNERKNACKVMLK